MPRYIDADALMAQLNRKKAEPCNKRYTEGFNDALMRFRSMVHSAPTVSPDEARGRGKWMKTDAFPHRVYCSNCFKTIVPNEEFAFWCEGIMPRNYCPNCGARMEVSEDA